MPDGVAIHSVCDTYFPSVGCLPAIIGGQKIFYTETVVCYNGLNGMRVLRNRLYAIIFLYGPGGGLFVQ